MRVALAVVLGLLSWGCNAATPKPKSLPLGTTEASTEEGQRRLYLELAPTRGDAELPGIWLQVTAPGSVGQKLPEQLAQLPVLAPFSDVRLVAAAMFGEQVSSVIDLAQPADVVMPIPPEGRSCAWSFRVRSPEAVASGNAGLALHRAAPGVWRIGASTAPDADEDRPGDDEGAEDYDDEEGDQPSVETPCQLRHFPEPVGYRVLCGAEPLLERVAAFLGSSRVLVPRAVDLHFEVGGSGYHEILDTAVAATRAKDTDEIASASERAGRQLGASLVQAFVEHERLGLDVTFDDGKAVLSLDVAYPARESSPAFETWLESSNAAVPPSFGQLPADSDVALGFGGLGSATGSQLVGVMLEHLMRSMDETSFVSDRERAELATALAGVVPGDLRFSMAFGRDRAAALQVLESDQLITADRTGQRLPVALQRELQASLWGWLAIGVEVPPKDFLPAVERLYRVSVKPLRDRPGVVEQQNHRTTSKLMRAQGPLKGLPTGTLQFVNQERPRPKYRPPADGSAPPALPYDVHFLVVPDGERTWLVVARSRALVLERALLLIRGQARVADRIDQQHAPAAALGAMSSSTAAYAPGDLDWDSAAQRSIARSTLRLISDFVESGSSRFPLWLSVIPREQRGPGWHLQLSTELTAQTIEELLMWRGLVDP